MPTPTDAHEQDRTYRYNDSHLQHSGVLMKLAALLALLVGVYAFVAGLAAGIAVAESTAIVPAVVEILGPTYTYAALGGVVLLATFAVLDETLDAVMVLRQHAEHDHLNVEDTNAE